MRFVSVFCALLAVAVGHPSSIVYEAQNFPSDPAPISSDTRVVGGFNAERNQFPYIASLQRLAASGSFSHICGGSIVSPNWIFTAAHCTPLGPVYRIVAGILLQNDQGVPGQQIIDVVEIFNHPGYPGNNVVAPDDVSLLRLATSLEYAENVQPIRIPPQGYIAGGPVVLSGWGITVPNGAIPNHLQFADLPLIPEQECNSILDGFLGPSRNPFDVDRNVCTGLTNPGQSACSGDSGGPLSQDGIVIGVVSWVLVPCGLHNSPSVYAKASAYSDWVVEITGGEVTP